MHYTSGACGAGAGGGGPLPRELAAMPGEDVVMKPRFSAFFGTDLHRTLSERGTTTLFLISTTTPNCIRTTCYDALSYDYDVVVIEDATSSRSPEVQRANIADMAFIGAAVLDSSAFARLCSEA